MTHRTRLSLRWFGICCTLSLGCTKLENPYQRFGEIASGNGGSTANAGQVGVSGTTMISAGEGGSNSAGGDRAGSGDSGGSGGSGGQVEMRAGAPTCNDDSGFHGLGCYRCAPTDIFTLENACTSATCTRFDDSKRVTLLGKDGKLPPLPSTSGGGGAGGTGGNPTAGSAAIAGGGGTVSSAGGQGGSGGTGKLCSALGEHGTVVYITGSTAAKPFLQQIAQQLVSQSVFIVYEATGSCVGVDAVVNGTPMTTGTNAPALTATYWDSSASNGAACDLPTAGVSADIGASDVFAESCPGFELANLDAQKVRDAHGPIQTMTFAVPANSAYTEISANAAYFAFGFGQTGGLYDESGTTPIWNDENYLFKRSATSGTQVMLAAAIGVPATAWRGKSHKSSDEVAADLQAAGQTQATANAALGIIAADYIDSKNLRAQLRVLAFQDSSQHCAVFPDSTSNAHDKRNVRDGHYPVWGPLHLLLRVDAQGKPINPESRQAVTDIIGYLSGTKALPNGVQLIDVYAQSGLVPECAMRVTRDKDGGNLLPSRPTSPCSCLFDVKATGSTACTPCVVQGDCKSGGTCSQGYCEAE